MIFLVILLILIPGLVTVFFQLLYLVLSFRVKIQDTVALQSGDEPAEEISIIIPVHGEDDTIGGCLQAILNNVCPAVKAVVVVLDHCLEETGEVVCSFVDPFCQQGVTLEVKTLPPNSYGKVRALIYGGKFITTQTALLLDADIILEKEAVSRLLAFHHAGGYVFSSCLIFPYDGDDQAHPLSQQIVCNNRLYRQSVIQTVKNLYGCSNFPGGLQMVHFEAYKRLLKDGFLEDLTATYSLLKSGGRVAILPEVLAYEVERKTIAGQFLQRVRWTIGAIQHIPDQMATARTRPRLIEKLLINSYHVMWELQYYVIAVNLLLIIVLPGLWFILCLPMLLYMCNIFRSVKLTWRYYRNSLFAAFLHGLIHPVIISAALPASVIWLICKRSYNFQSRSLFRRI